MASTSVARNYETATIAPRKRSDALGRRFVRFWEEQRRLDGVGRKLSKAVSGLESKLPGGENTVNFLHGVYIGHALHPLLTDVPIGAFTMAMLLDMTSSGQREPSRAATRLLAIGLASVPVTALAGALDWQYTYGKTKRVGVGHLALNGLGSTVLAASLLTRGRENGPTRLLNYLGNGILTLSAYLGGHLSLEAGVGTRHVAQESPPEHFVAVMPESDLANETLTRAEADGFPVVLYRRGSQVYAMADVCPHLGCSLAEGSVEGDDIVCGCHGSKFALIDGTVVLGPSAYPNDAYATRVVDGVIEVSPWEGVSR